ncbi:hypothetical protein E2320_022821, partial [Naja naja]
MLKLTAEVLVLWESSAARQRSSCTLGDCFGWLLLPVTLLIVAWLDKLAAFPTSLNGCGQECYDDRENDLFVCDTKTCKFDRECLRIGDTVTCLSVQGKKMDLSF